MEIKLPKKISDCRIKHFEAVKYLTQCNGILDFSQKLKLIEKFSGYKYSELMLINKIDIEKIFLHILSVFGNYKPNVEPDKEMIVNGRKYELIDFNKVGVAWHIDVTGLEVEKNPILMASICYFPKGEMYGTTDENENILFPISERKKEFEEHFPLDKFLDLNTFFLSKWFKLTNEFHLKEKTMKRTLSFLKKLKLKSMNG